MIQMYGCLTPKSLCFSSTCFSFVIKYKGIPWWPSVHLPMQETRICSLVWEGLTCLGAIKPSAPPLPSLRSRARELQLLKPKRPRACAPQKRSHCNEKPVHHDWRVPPLTPTRKKSEQQRRPSTP